MYQPDSLDKLIMLTVMPPCDVGAPVPVVLASESVVQLAYVVAEDPVTFDPERNDIVNRHPGGELFAVVRFLSPRAHFMGPPNDEASAGHPLYGRGFQPYSAMEVVSSSWIRSLERMNTVHPRHTPERYRQDRHFIFAFHDSTFECVAKSCEITTLPGSLTAVCSYMSQQLDLTGV